MERTRKLGLPFIMPAQAQKHLTHNEALRMLDTLVQLSVVSRQLQAPPEEPASGERHLVAADATGAWLGRGGQIAAYQDGGWQFHAPANGWCAFVEDEDALIAFRDGSWSLLADAAGERQRLGINAGADDDNRLAVASPAVLFSHEGAGHQVKVNKAGADDTASLLFQTGFSGRAEMGTTGSDDFTVKVSPDGEEWREAMAIAALDAIARFPAGIRLGAGGALLDRFEQGEFVPSLTFANPGDLAVTYGDRMGVYWRFGSLVVALVHLSASPAYTSATGQLRIFGLPATVAHPMVANTFQHGSSTGYPAGSSTLVTRPEAGTSHFICLGLGAGTATPLSTLHVPSGQLFVARALLVFRAGG